MSKRQVFSVLFVTTLSGFLLGLAASWVSLGETVNAQSRSAQNVPSRITARAFDLVDERNVKRASLFTYGKGRASGTTFLLKDRNGETRFSVTVDEEGTPNAHLFAKDAEGAYRPTSFPSISFWDRGNRRLEARLPGSAAGRGSLAGPGKIRPLPTRRGDAKADNARPQDVRLLQRQVDQMWVRLEEVIERLNASAE